MLLAAAAQAPHTPSASYDPDPPSDGMGQRMRRRASIVLPIAIHRLRINVLTARWQLLSILLLALCGLSLLFSLRSYQKSRASYSADLTEHAIDCEPAKIHMYLQVQQALDRAPEPLWVLAPGTREEFGSCALVRGHFGATVIASREKSNPFLLDVAWGSMTQIVGVMGGLLAILLSADALSSGRQEGSLQMMLSEPVARWQVLIGEYLGGLFATALPLFLMWLVVLLVFGLHPDLGLDQTTSPILAVMFLLSLSYVSICVLAGLLISTRTSEPATSMTAGLLVWVLMCFVVPDSAVAIARYLRPVENLADLTARDVLAAISFGPKKDDGIPPEVKADNLRRRFDQTGLAAGLEMVSPLASYRQSCETLAGTDIMGHRRWLESVRRLEDDFVRWQKAKIRMYPQRVNHYLDDPPLDLDGLPRGAFSPQTLRSRASRVILPAAVLAVFNLLVFYLSYVSVVRYDPRFR